MNIQDPKNTYLRPPYEQQTWLTCCQPWGEDGQGLILEWAPSETIYPSLLFIVHSGNFEVDAISIMSGT